MRIRQNLGVFNYIAFYRALRGEVRAIAYMKAVMKCGVKMPVWRMIILNKLYRYECMTKKEIMFLVEFISYTEITKQMNALRELGLIRSEKIDKKTYVFYLTEDGKALVKKFTQHYKKAIKLVFETYGQESRDIWGGILSSAHPSCEEFLERRKAKEGAVLRED